jgi:RNA polymerase sigma factor (sigma-70 family)
MTEDTALMHDDSSATALVIRARNGDERAWEALVERYAPLVWSICRRNRLGGGEDDVFQIVWLQLVDKLATIRDPAALPGWLATTTQRECLRALHAVRSPQAVRHVPDVEIIPDMQARTVEHELLLAERHAALLEAFTCLPPKCQQLMAMLIQDPPVPYTQISNRLGIPAGSIGPSRSRCLEKLRRHPAIAALIDAEASSGGISNLWLSGCSVMTPNPQRRSLTHYLSHPRSQRPQKGGRPMIRNNELAEPSLSFSVGAARVCQVELT